MCAVNFQIVEKSDSFVKTVIKLFCNKACKPENFISPEKNGSKM